jgi:hypothetical protein
MFRPPHGDITNHLGRSALGLAAGTAVLSLLAAASHGGTAQGATPEMPWPVSSGPATARSGMPWPLRSFPTTSSVSIRQPSAPPHPELFRSPAVPASARHTSRPGGDGAYPRPSTSTSDGVPVPQDGAVSPNAGAARWTSYLPPPQVGLKIFLGGLIGLAVSITGLATLAFRRREY